MASLFKNPGYSKPNGHNGFDMSMRRLFTAPPGMLLPVYNDVTQAGDSYKLNVDAFCRTEAVETAAFQQFKLHFDWFFVPFRQLYSFWNEFYNGTFDANTNFVNNQDKFALPTCDVHLTDTDVYQDSMFFEPSETDPDSYVVLKDDFGVPVICNTLRLWDLLGYGTITDVLGGSVSLQFDYNIFPYKHLAYHKIFFSHYFRGDWTERDTSLFNVDSYHGGKDIGIWSSILSKIHYRPYHRDYFTNVFPSPVFNDKFASIVQDSFLQTSGPNFLASENPNPNNTVGMTGYGNQPSPYPSMNYDPSDQVITAVGLRSLFNYDKLVRLTSLAGSHYTEQMRAHFGVTINNDIHNEAYFIGSQCVDINVSEVVATATTDAAGKGNNLGDIAGKGFGASPNSEDLHFTCKEQGVLMCIASIEPLQMYASYGMERNCRYKDTFDFYRPELDNLGMQPAYADELDPNVLAKNNLCGYQYRYSELKTKVDLVNAGYWAGPKRYWQCNYQQGIGTAVTSVLSRFYIGPSYADNIFPVKFPLGPEEFNPVKDGSMYKTGNFASPIQIYSGDNFLINAMFLVQKKSLMSVHSLPQLY